MRRLTQDRLKELLHYNPETGVFTWRKNLKGGAKAGANPNFRTTNGYHTIGVDGRRYLAHRLAWLYMSGDWPAALIDHKDRDRTNNRWENLREATHRQNVVNSKSLVTNTSGTKGVSYAGREGQWHAYIGVDGKRLTLGYFHELSDAVAARRTAERQYNGEFTPSFGS